MGEYLWVGQELFHKYLGFITVTSISDNELLADTGSKGILPFAFNNFGRVLFFEEDHRNTEHKSYNDYLVFCQEELKNKAIQKAKAAEDFEELMIKKLEEAAREEKEKNERVRRIEDSKKKYSNQKRDGISFGTEYTEVNSRKFNEIQGKKIIVIPKDYQIKSLFPNQEMLMQVKKRHEDKVLEVVKKRKIEHLIHFTRIENLSGILQHGLVPVSMHEKMKIKSIRNDEKRYDQRRDCTSCSIGFPNWQLFYSFQIRDLAARWVIIRLKPEVLFSPQGINLFCKTNAARVLPKCTNFTTLCTITAFEGMFCDPIMTSKDQSISRAALQIPDYMTTDPQAEILVSDIIDTKYIDSICFKDPDDIKQYIQNYGASVLKLYDYSSRSFLFEPRKDYKLWEKET